MNAMEMLIGTLVKAVGIDPAEAQKVFAQIPALILDVQTKLAEYQTKQAELDAKLARILALLGDKEVVSISVEKVHPQENSYERTRLGTAHTSRLVSTGTIRDANTGV